MLKPALHNPTLDYRVIVHNLLSGPSAGDTKDYDSKERAEPDQ
jgi:hypothetical protein